jgi:hypothetical protein
MGLTHFEALYGRPFFQKDLILDPKVTNLGCHITQLAKFQQVLCEVGREEPQGLSLAAFCPGDLVLIKFPHNPWGLSEAPWEGPFLVLLSTPAGIKVAGLDSWTHNSPAKCWTPEPDTPTLSHTLLHQPTPVSQWKTSNIFSIGTPQAHDLCIHFLPFCELFTFWFSLFWVLVCGQLLPLSGYGPNK